MPGILQSQTLGMAYETWASSQAKWAKADHKFHMLSQASRFYYLRDTRRYRYSGEIFFIFYVPPISFFFLLIFLFLYFPSTHPMGSLLTKTFIKGRKNQRKGKESLPQEGDGRENISAHWRCGLDVRILLITDHDRKFQN